MTEGLPNHNKTKSDTPSMEEVKSAILTHEEYRDHTFAQNSEEKVHMYTSSLTGSGRLHTSGQNIQKIQRVLCLTRSEQLSRKLIPIWYM